MREETPLKTEGGGAVTDLDEALVGGEGGLVEVEPEGEGIGLVGNSRTGDSRELGGREGDETVGGAELEVLAIA